jgi:hypothetical protein
LMKRVSLQTSFWGHIVQALPTGAGGVLVGRGVFLLAIIRSITTLFLGIPWFMSLSERAG